MADAILLALDCIVELILAWPERDGKKEDGKR
jgi:hypothetical protein